MLASESRVRIPAIASLAAWLLLLAPSPAGAQVHAPSLVEGDLPDEDPKAKAAARSGETVPEPALPPEPLPPPPAAPSGADASTSQGLAPGVSIGPEELKRLQRPIQPVGISPGRIEELWLARRKADREQDGAASRAAAASLRDAMRELGIASLPWHAIAEVRDAERSLRVRAVDDAVEHAAIAVALAPDLPEPHFALARARIAAEPTRPLAALRAAWAGLGAAARDPHVARALLGDLFGAAIAALFGAAAATIGVLFLLRLRIFLHDFRHLPMVRSGTPGQATALALALLALPFVFRLGPFAVLLAAALAAWAYLSNRERIAVSVSLLALVAIPTLAGQAARVTAWQGTLADDVHEIEAGWPTPEFVAEMKARSTREQFPAPALLAIGRWHKRQGDLAEARRWYDAALVADPRSAEAQVNLGNLFFLEGDLEGAKSAYLAAVDRARDGTSPPWPRRSTTSESSTSGWPAWARARRPAARPSRPTPPTWPGTGRTTTFAPTPGWWTLSPPPSAWPSSPRATRCHAPSGRRRSSGWRGRSPGGDGLSCRSRSSRRSGCSRCSPRGSPRRRRATGAAGPPAGAATPGRPPAVDSA